MSKKPQKTTPAPMPPKWLLDRIRAEVAFTFPPDDRKRLLSLTDAPTVAALERHARGYQFFRAADSQGTRAQSRRDMKRESALLDRVRRALEVLMHKEGATDETARRQARAALCEDAVAAMQARAEQRTKRLESAIAETFAQGGNQPALKSFIRSIWETLTKAGLAGERRDQAARIVLRAIDPERKHSDPFRSRRN